jgi:hypothetical protein
MIRLALACVLVFLLPAAAYFGYVALTDGLWRLESSERKTFSDHVDGAPLALLFILGSLGLFGTLATLVTLQEVGTDVPYAPAIFKDGKIEKGGS